LNIPGIHGVADTLIYFVDRYRDFSIYDVDFVPLAATEARPPAIAGLHWFGVVQSILGDRTADWLDFYQNLFGFTILPRGRIEINIPGIHGVADTLIYFVDRYRDFSIYDVDFVPLAATEARPPAIAGLHWFGVVQSILGDRTADWLDFYQNLFGFTILPRGRI